MPKKKYSQKDILKELYLKNLELHRERKRIQEILLQVAEVIFAVDQDYKITLINASAESIFNISVSACCSVKDWPLNQRTAIIVDASSHPSSWR